MSKRVPDFIHRMLLVMAWGGVVGSHPVSAQAPDLVSELQSPSWQIRASAVASLTPLSPSRLPVGAAAALVALLNREAQLYAVGVNRDSSEAYGEYLVSLVRAVVPLNDPIALTGLAVLGIRVSEDARDQVVAAGAAAIAPLLSAWGIDSSDRVPVLETMTALIVLRSDAMSPQDLKTLWTYVLGANAFQLALVVKQYPLPELLPVIVGDSASAQTEFARTEIDESTVALSQVRQTRTNEQILTRALQIFGFLCFDASGARIGACRSIGNLGQTALYQMGAGHAKPAIETLAALAKRADEARRAGALSANEASLMGGAANEIIQRFMRASP